MDFFKLKQNNTTISTEIYAGITTFMTMAYILAVNPLILGDAGMNSSAVFTATALASVIGTLAMAFLANYPFALAPGMGLNAYFAYVVAAKYGWEIALCAVCAEGIIFMLFSFVNLREAIFEAIPKNIRRAVSVGIGLFIAFVGFRTSGIVVSDADTLITLGDVADIRVCLALIGTIITGLAIYLKIKGALFWGILLTYFLGVVCEFAGLYQPVPEAGINSIIPDGIISLPPSIADINLFTAVKHIDFSAVSVFDFAVVIISFLFVDMFDTVGTLVGVSEKAGFTDNEGRLPKLKQALRQTSKA